MDTAMQPCEDQKVIWLVLWVFSWVVSHNQRVVFVRERVDIGVVIVFAMAWGGLILVMFVARFAWSGQCSQCGGKWKRH